MTNHLMIVGAALVLLPALPAQQSRTMLPPDDPRLYQLFFHFQDDLYTVIQRKKADNIEVGLKAEIGLANKLRIKPQELQKVCDLAHAFVIDLGTWQRDLKAHVDSARAQNQEPDPAEFRLFNQRKLQLIEATIKQLSGTLSPASWAGLRGYINDEHRLHTSVVQFK